MTLNQIASAIVLSKALYKPLVDGFERLVIHPFNLARATLELTIATILSIHSGDSNEILAKKTYIYAHQNQSG